MWVRDTELRLAMYRSLAHSRIAHTISTRSRCTMLHPMCLSRHGHASGLSFSWTRTNADAAGQDLWNIHGGSWVAAGWSVAVVLFKKLNIETRTNTDHPFPHGGKRMRLYPRAYINASGSDLYENAFASYRTACSRQASRQRQIICLANWSVV